MGLVACSSNDGTTIVDCAAGYHYPVGRTDHCVPDGSSAKTLSGGDARSKSDATVPSGQVVDGATAIAIAREDGDIQRVDRVRAKLVKMGDILNATTPNDRPGVDHDEVVWAVAIGGEIRNEGDRTFIPQSTPLGPCSWALSLLHRNSGRLWMLIRGLDGGWPPGFDAVPAV